MNWSKEGYIKGSREKKRNGGWYNYIMISIKKNRKPKFYSYLAVSYKATKIHSPCLIFFDTISEEMNKCLLRQGAKTWKK